MKDLSTLGRAKDNKLVVSFNGENIGIHVEGQIRAFDLVNAAFLIQRMALRYFDEQDAMKAMIQAQDSRIAEEILREKKQ